MKYRLYFSNKNAKINKIKDSLINSIVEDHRKKDFDKGNNIKCSCKDDDIFKITKAEDDAEIEFIYVKEVNRKKVSDDNWEKVAALAKSEKSDGTAFRKHLKPKSYYFVSNKKSCFNFSFE